MKHRCPHCGKEIVFEVKITSAEIPEVEYEILDILRRNNYYDFPDNIMKTRTIAKRIGLGDDQTLRHLKHLEDRGMVKRVAQRGGWLVEADHKPRRIREYSDSDNC